MPCWPPRFRSRRRRWTPSWPGRWTRSCGGRAATGPANRRSALRRGDRAATGSRLGAGQRLARPDASAGLTAPATRMQERPPRAWHVFVTYVIAVAGIVATTGVAIEILRAVYPDMSATTLVRTLPGLLALSLAASSGLLLTLVLVVRPLDAARFRLRPGWETGPTLAAMTLGFLALGQALDSLTTVLGLADRGALVLIRQALRGAGGADLFGAVLVLGVGAGAAEEVFFRGYMQSRLREHWSPAAAVTATAAAFAALHA